MYLESTSGLTSNLKKKRTNKTRKIDNSMQSKSAIAFAAASVWAVLGANE